MNLSRRFINVKITIMKKIKTVLCMSTAIAMLSSCAIVRSPLTGFIYTDMKSPMAITSNSGSSKVGMAKAQSILGIAATGDASIEAAAKSAGITKIHHVDEHGTSILGIVASYEVIVYGE
jgi:hypothetical protein